jgi:hypothetical protein
MVFPARRADRDCPHSTKPIRWWKGSVEHALCSYKLGQQKNAKALILVHRGCLQPHQQLLRCDLHHPNPTTLRKTRPTPWQQHGLVHYEYEHRGWTRECGRNDKHCGDQRQQHALQQSWGHREAMIPIVSPIPF